MSPSTEPFSKLSRRRRLSARLRGGQTLERMRRAGLDAPGPLYIADRVYIDPTFAWAVTIRAHTTIAHDVRVIAHDAAIKHLTGYTEVLPVVIGEACYIGAGAIVLPGATLGDGAVIGAGSVVRGEIPAGAIAAGNPARVIGQASELRDRHKQLQAHVRCFEREPIDGVKAHELTAMREALAKDGRIYVL
jgi:NDP-sugar pyrophosphorylase family protein